jgi:Tfp pilus assembly PilM family ATPase
MKFKKIKGTKSIVVFEIGDEWVKIIDNSPSAAGNCITKVGFIKVDKIKEPVANVVVKAFRRMKLDKRAVIMYIPRNSVSVRIMEFPSTNRREIADMVSLQVRRQIPYAKEEIISTYRVIDGEREGYTKVLLVIASRKLVDDHLNILQKYGIHIERISMSSEAVLGWFNVAYMSDPRLADTFASDNVVVLVDVDYNYSDFIIIKKKKLVFTRNILIGANQLLTDETSHNKFIEEIRHSIEFYQNEEIDVGIAKIFLSGAVKDIKDLDRRLTDATNIPVEVAYSLRNIRVKDDVDALREESCKFISATPLLGAAMSRKDLELDLVPFEIRLQKMMEDKRKQITVTGVLSFFIVAMASFLLLMNIYGKNIYLNKLKQKTTQIEREAKEIETMRLRIDLIEKRLDAKGSCLNILDEIHRITPEEIFLTVITVEEKRQAVLRGRALAMSDVFKFIATVEDSAYFENVKTTYTTTKKEGDKEYAEFELICTYEDR